MRRTSILIFGGILLACLGARARGQDSSAGDPAAPREERFHQNLAWSPDGKQLGYSELEGGSNYRPDAWSLWIVDVDGESAPRRVVENANWVDWSPDGLRLAFDSARSGDSEIYLLELESGEIRRMTEDPAADGAPAWSPDGRRLVFSSDRSGDRHLFLLDVESLAVSPLTTGEGKDYNAHWTPDGERVVFYRELGDGHDQVWSIRVDGTDARQLSDPGRHNVFPQVFADGSVLWGSSVPGGATTLVRRHPEGGELENLLAGVETDIARPSPDGRTLAYVTGSWPRSTIWLAAPDGSARRRLVN